MVEFYQKYSVLLPNLSTIDQGKSMIKLKDKIYYMKKKLYKEKDKKTTINNANKVELEEKKQYDMSNQILTSKFKEELNKSYKNYPSRMDEKTKHETPYLEGYVYGEDSFESDSFDIYNPGNSIETFSSFELAELNNNKEAEEISMFKESRSKLLYFKDEIL